MHLYPSFQYVQKYGSAFLNSEGGVLLGGVRDDGNCIIFTWVAMVEPDKIISVLLFVSKPNFFSTVVHHFVNRNCSQEFENLLTGSIVFDEYTVKYFYLT